jgi:pimeloyl-ACP methyl ester carboxylesterase
LPALKKAIGALVLLLLGACSVDRTLEAIDVLGDISARDGPSALKRSTPEPRRRAVDYRIDERTSHGDLYFGPDPRAGVVLVPGAARGGKDDPRLVAFANTLARARFVVLVPDIESLRELKVSPADARAVADAVRHLSAAIPGPDRKTVGIVAISYAAGPAVLAALEEDARAHVRFVLSIGGYYDLEAVVTFFTTGYYRVPGNDRWLHREPNAYGKWVFVKSNAERLESPKDRVTLSEMADRKLDDLRADVGALAASLDGEGRRVWALLANADPNSARGLIADLPPAVRRDLVALDISRRDLSRLAARLILVHGRDDAIIPFTESEAFAAKLPDGQARLHVVDSLAHVDLGPSGMLDGIAMVRAVYGLLEERDAMAPPKLP